MISRSLKAVDISAVSEALGIAEEKTGDFYKFSFGHWKRHRYDVRTLPVLRDDEIAPHAFALLNRYSRVTGNFESISKKNDFYFICLQDHQIIGATMMWIGMLAALTLVAPQILSIILPIDPLSYPSFLPEWAEMVIWPGLGLFGLSVWTVEENAALSVLYAYLILFTSLLIGNLMAISRLNWLLLPLSYQGVFNKELPGRLRKDIRFIITTTIMPLGRLVVPIWIYITKLMSRSGEKDTFNT